MTAIGATALPHWMLRRVTVSGARNSTALTPKLDGFHRCRPLNRRTYLVVIEIRLQRKYGQRKGERTRMPTLMPVMYALAG